MTLKKRLALGVSIVIALCLAVWLLVVIWDFEESRKDVQTTVIKNPDDSVAFAVKLKERPAGEYLIVCTEDRFKESFDHFRRFLSLKNEPFHSPGGAMLLALSPKDVPEKLGPAKRALIEYLERHSPERIVLVAHDECLLYDVVGAWQDHPEHVRARQIQDLVRAKQLINEWFPKTNVEIWYASLSNELDAHENILNFQQLDPDTLFPSTFQVEPGESTIFLGGDGHD